MKKTTLLIALFSLLLVGCNIFSTRKNLPILTTITPYKISTFSCKCGGNIISSGDDSIQVKGVCWSTQTNPTIIDSIQISNNTSSNYICRPISLDSCTTYYIRAFASNKYGTGYGHEFSFTTLNNILVGSWKYTNEESGEWHTITFNSNMTWISYASSIWDFADSGKNYTFDDETLILTTSDLYAYHIFDYSLNGDTLIVAHHRIYLRQ